MARLGAATTVQSPMDRLVRCGKAAGYVCRVCVVARLNVYVPDELAEEARRAGLGVSAVAQEAIRRALAARSTDTWLARLRPAPPHLATHESALSALDAIRDELPTKHA